MLYKHNNLNESDIPSQFNIEKKLNEEEYKHALEECAEYLEYFEEDEEDIEYIKAYDVCTETFYIIKTSVFRLLRKGRHLGYVDDIDDDCNYFTNYLIDNNNGLIWMWIDKPIKYHENMCRFLYVGSTNSDSVSINECHIYDSLIDLQNNKPIENVTLEDIIKMINIWIANGEIYVYDLEDSVVKKINNRGFRVPFYFSRKNLNDYFIATIGYEIEEILNDDYDNFDKETKCQQSALYLIDKNWKVQKTYDIVDCDNNDRIVIKDSRTRMKYNIIYPYSVSTYDLYFNEPIEKIYTPMNACEIKEDDYVNDGIINGNITDDVLEDMDAYICYNNGRYAIFTTYNEILSNAWFSELSYINDVILPSEYNGDECADDYMFAKGEDDVYIFNYSYRNKKIEEVSIVPKNIMMKEINVGKKKYKIIILKKGDKEYLSYTNNHKNVPVVGMKIIDDAYIIFKYENNEYDAFAVEDFVLLTEDKDVPCEYIMDVYSDFPIIKGVNGKYKYIDPLWKIQSYAEDIFTEWQDKCYPYNDNDETFTVENDGETTTYKIVLSSNKNYTMSRLEIIK